MFELKIASNDATSGTIPVSWCVDHETIKLLAEHAIKDPQVVIVVAPDSPAYHISKEYRNVVPLKDLMTYVEFRVPGVNKIWGFISLRNEEGAKDTYLARSSGSYITNILNHDGSNWGYELSVERYETNQQLNSQSIDVKVPKGCFAKEPSSWERAWVNHFFRDKALDQCEFRRRRLFAYGLQPLLLLGNMLLRSLFLLVSALCLFREISIQPLIHPLRYDLEDAFNVMGGGTYCVHRLEEDVKTNWEPETVGETYSYIFRSYWSVPLMPIVAIPLLLLAFFHCWTTLMGLGIALGAILLVIGIISAFVTDSVSQWSILISRFLRGNFNPADGEDDSEDWFSDPDEIDALVCTNNSAPRSLSSLPTNKKTMKLKFLDLKSRVCRPFSV